jgi:tetratricopeptide (TPR) repeat protein
MLNKKLNQEINNLLILFKDKKTDQFIRLSNKLIKNYPNCAILQNVFGYIETQKRNTNNAKKFFHKALEYDEKYLPSIKNLINIYSQEKNYFALKGCLKKYLKIEPAASNYIFSLGLTLKNLNEYEESIKYFKKFLEFDPNNYKAHHSLSISYQRLGKFDEAYREVRKSIQLNKKFDTRLLLAYDLADFLKFDIKSYIKKFNEIIQNNSDSEISSGIFLRLAKYFEKNKDHKKALNFYKNLNGFKKTYKSIFYWNDISKIDFSIQQLEQIQSQFKLNPLEIKPIFILGLPRSGTTLLEQALSAHPKIRGLGEQQTFLEGGRQILFNPEYINNDSLINYKNFVSNDISKMFDIKNEKYFIDKNPMNFEIIPMIRHVFPESKIIYLKRDPRDICWSIFTNTFTEEFLDLNIEGLINYINDHKKIMNLYLRLYKENIHIISYEMLVTNPIETIKNIIQFLELEMDHSCLSPELNKNPIATASVIEARQKISDKNIARWKPYEEFLLKYFKKLQ